MSVVCQKMLWEKSCDNHVKEEFTARIPLDYVIFDPFVFRIKMFFAWKWTFGMWGQRRLKSVIPSRMYNLWIFGNLKGEKQRFCFQFAQLHWLNKVNSFKVSFHGMPITWIRHLWVIASFRYRFSCTALLNHT